MSWPWPVAALAPGLLLAQAVPEPYGILTQYGVAGLCAFLLYRRYEGELSRERAARERAEQQADALAERAISDLAPLVAEVARTMVPALEQLSAEVARMGERVQRTGERIDRLESGR